MKLFKDQRGFQTAVVYLSIFTLILAAFLGYLIYKRPSKVPAYTPVATTISQAPATTPPTVATSSSSTTSSSSSSLASQLQAVESTNDSSTADLNSANTGINDQSTFTGY